MKQMWDAISPNAGPAGWEAAAGYIPGGDAYHGWTDKEWMAEHARYRLPIWVRSNPTNAAEGNAEGHAAIAWAKRHGQPLGTCIALDLETAVNGPYVNAFNATLYQSGYRAMAYGSLSTIFRNPKPHGGYWVAHYTGTPHMEKGADATQYANLGRYDASLVNDSVPLWDTKTKPVKAVELQSGELKNGPGVIDAIAIAPGEHAISFIADNGKQGLPAAAIRVAVSKKGVWVVSEHKVDSHNGATVVTFADPANTDGVSVVRMDNGSVAVGWVVY